MLELSLFGGFEARTGPGRPVVLPTRKVRALLAYLALHADEALPRETLAGLLWSDRAEPQANNSLSQAVTALRKALAECDQPPLGTGVDNITFVGAAAAVDVHRFEQSVAAGGLADLEEAEALYQGDLLAGINVRDPVFEEWLDFEQQRLHALAVNALTRLLVLREKQAQKAELVTTAEKLLRLDPFQEEAHRALMRYYAGQGQTGLALRQYQICADTLRRELGVEPQEETARTRDEIMRQRPSGSGANTAGAEAAAPAGVTRPPRGRRLGALGVLAGLLVVAAGLALFRPWDTAPGRPSIVVLPFANESGEPGQESFADGMTKDLITDLTKISGLFVISESTSSEYAGARPRKASRELGVRYVVEGSVRRARGQVRINVRLIDGSTEGTVWGESYDGAISDVFALQDRITGLIVDSLELELLPKEAWRVQLADTGNVQAFDAFNKGRTYYYRRTPENNALAAAQFERAIALDPDYSAAYTALAKVYVQAVIGEQAYADELGIFWTEGYTRAWRLLKNDGVRPNADFRVLRSWLSLRKYQQDRAVAEAKAALEFNPNDSDALEALAEALIYAGRPEEGIAYARQAMVQNPLLPGRPHYLMGLAEFALGNPEKTVEQVTRAVELAPGKRVDFSGLLAAAYGELGRVREAGAAFDDYRQGLLNRPTLAWSVSPQPFSNPRFHTWRRVGLAWAVYAHPFRDRAVQERLAAGFKNAGASAGVAGYLPLDKSNRLGGSEVRSLLFGKVINGKSFWMSDATWRQRRTPDGRIGHEGYPVHPGLGRSVSGVGRIEGDRLCEQWPAAGGSFETCVVIYRIPDGNARIRWGDYVMVTDTGPHPFSLAD